MPTPSGYYISAKLTELGEAIDSGSGDRVFEVIRSIEADGHHPLAEIVLRVILRVAIPAGLRHPDAAVRREALSFALGMAPGSTRPATL